MKTSKFFLIAVMFCLVYTVTASNGDPKTKNSKENKSPENTYSFDDIFIDDVEGNVLFVDFQPIQDQVTHIRVYQGDRLVIEDDVSKLPADIIYEVDLVIMPSGLYRVELETSRQVRIAKEIVK